ncbi:hypothetical protein [Tenacibaculum finnmarkense]|uniref:Uncharacterized protein n=1 Tax=Tenacibaculum finnmarkense genomovar finnmarkense TaxID=1458503 RepID=A0AAP1RHB8_9FLAO|nr:hypothetical protein [Tenacibaculum finnmarkense]MBE7653923.1 hypothetical protein [Tenacibaculum finnmarkense genomovar finnmarkense]MBE7696225.1 hypothetical protein [Tenacibaculum finnmarkense genomovar finnmarkense]MCD8428313.1 hypothetical protein [Tenacibaculum finnmarkense genomovar finnmarkense]MCD8440872.1 hypothetical protein [Tenacibaculum finnmarkense genomovar ulcerans]MCG8721784.1 hypothetical protein [Tenacibaculum finnmarkense]
MLYVQDRKYPYVYEKFETPVLYDFKINEYTELQEHIIKNNYQQQLEVDLISHHASNVLVFNVNTTKHQYVLDASLKKQELLIRQLNSLTATVELEINATGDIGKVLNYEEIKEKWELLLPKLKRHHQGVLAHGYLEGIGKKIKDENRFTTDLKQYRLFGVLFNSLLRIPFDDKSVKSRTRIFTNVIHCLPIHITEQLTLVEEDVITNLLTYKVTGVLHAIDVETTARINKYLRYYDIGTDPIYLENYSGYYKINKYTAWTAKAEITCTLSNGRGYRRELHFSLEDKGYE